MGSIHELDTELINKIAAGEVIERPASAVKELVENAIDASARRISVEVSDAGEQLIRVSDDGSGMAPEDALLAPRRHTTSKIASAEDLFSISTLGFRGEALASIASVGHLTLRTRPREAEVGTEVSVKAGVPQAREIACAPGTVAEVRELFHNTPARRKHLSSRQTELRHIVDLLGRYALSYPEVAFTLLSDGRELLRSPGDGDARAAVLAVYGRETAKALIPVTFSGAHLTVRGFVSRPQLTRASADQQSIFVNGRLVSNPVISRAVDDAYHTLMHLERKPVVVLRVEMPPGQVDVNVHPTKREVRLAHEQVVYQGVYEAIRSTLQERQLIPEEKFPQTEMRLAGFGAPPRPAAMVRDAGPAEVARPLISGEQQAALAAPVTAVEGTGRFPSLQVVGQALSTYILCESEDGLCIVDQHAAEERVLYERFRGQRYATGLKTQALLSPAIAELAPAELRILEEHMPLLRELGFGIEPFGPGAVRVLTVPVVFGRVQDAAFLHDLLAELLASKELAREQREERIMRMACRAAVKANDILSLEQMRKILEELSRCEMPFTCPHGRPTLFRITSHELERRFKRIA